MMEWVKQARRPSPDFGIAVVPGDSRCGHEGDRDVRREPIRPRSHGDAHLGGRLGGRARCGSGAASAATPTPPGRDGLIAFVSLSPQGEPRGLAVIRPDGGGFRQLTRNRYDSLPAWSPDGRRIAFERTGAIYVMRSDKTRVRKLTTPRIRGDRWPAWSPNGGEIAFTREGAAVFVMRADGTRQRRSIGGEAASSIAHRGRQTGGGSRSALPPTSCPTAARSSSSDAAAARSTTSPTDGSSLRA